MRVALQPRAIGQAPPLEWGHPLIRRGSGTLVAVVSGEAGAAPPLQLGHRFVAHFVRRLVKGSVPTISNVRFNKA